MKLSSVARVAAARSASIPLAQLLRVMSTQAVTDKLRGGTKLSQNGCFSAADIARYTQLTGDGNPIHSNASAAQEAGFNGCVVPGMLCGSLFPAIIGSRFAGAVYVSQTLKFKAPLLVGESFIAEVEVTAVQNLKRYCRVTFSTRCFKKEIGHALVDGQAVALVPSSLVSD